MICHNAFLNAPDIWIILGLGIGLVAVGLYFLRFRVNVVSEKIGTQFRVNVSSRNFWFDIHELECEIVATSGTDFRVVSTLALVKSKTLTLAPNDEAYVFKTSAAQQRKKSTNAPKLLRIRLSALNPIGVKKYKSYIHDISRYETMEESKWRKLR